MSSTYLLFPFAPLIERYKKCLKIAGFLPLFPSMNFSLIPLFMWGPGFLHSPYPPLAILRKFTRSCAPVPRWESHRDLDPPRVYYLNL